jgi:YHS domain-containing protein
MVHKRVVSKVRVYDELSGKTFYFKSHADKEKFFDAWDRLVLKVE